MLEYFAFAVLLAIGATCYETKYIPIHDSGQLPCATKDLVTQVHLVRWVKTPDSSSLSETPVAFWDLAETEPKVTENYDINSNLSLIINEAKSNNEGLFYCYVVYEDPSPSQRYIRLIVQEPNSTSADTTATTYTSSKGDTSTVSTTTTTERQDTTQGLQIWKIALIVCLILSVFLPISGLCIYHKQRRNRLSRTKYPVSLLSLLSHHSHSSHSLSHHNTVELELVVELELEQLKALEGRKAHCNRSRIIVVGPAGVGKTSLIRRLTGQEFDPQQKSTIGTEHNTVNKDTVSDWSIDNETHRDDLAESMVLLEDTVQMVEPSEELTDTQSEDSENRETTISSTGDTDIPHLQVLAQTLTKERITQARSSAHDLSYSIWDFGGQDIYYITHPLFLSWRSLYIVAFPFHLNLDGKPPRTEEWSGNTPSEDSSKDSLQTSQRSILKLIEFWLMSIYVHAVPPPDSEEKEYEPKIVLIGTFSRHTKPKLTEDDLHETESKIWKMIRGKPFENYIHGEIMRIDNCHSKDEEVTEIRHQIDSLIKESGYMTHSYPILWRGFLEELRPIQKDTMHLHEAKAIMTKLGIKPEEEVGLLKFCHDVGDIIYHEGCDLIVLNPHVLNSYVSNIITVVDDSKLKGKLRYQWKQLIETGVLSMTLLKDVWGKHKGKIDDLSMLIDMMVKLDLICQPPQNSEWKGCFFVPCRSCRVPPPVQQHKRDDEFQFTIDFESFLPDGYLHRFYVRMSKWSLERGSCELHFHYRGMLFYVDEYHRCHMTSTITDDDVHQIKVTVIRISPYGASENRAKKVALDRSFLSYVQNTLEDVRNTWARRLSFSFGLRCKTPQCKAVVPLEKLLTCNAAPCDKCLGAMDTGSLKQALRTPEERDEISTAELLWDRPTDLVTEELLNALSKVVPHTNYYELCNNLFCKRNTHNQAANILVTARGDYIEATKVCLHEWKNRTGGKLSELEQILLAADLGDLIGTVLPRQEEASASTRKRLNLVQRN